VLSGISLPLMTSVAVLTEAMFLLNSYGGWRLQDRLWRKVLAGDLDVLHINGAHLVRMLTLMQKYQDVPMDFADASPVALAEPLNVSRIFTLDSDFHVYRLHGTQPFDVVP
jgi:predicted nucleic acid-binding protein